MKTFKFTQANEIANALSNVTKEQFLVDFTDSPHGDFKVKCFHDKNDDLIAVSTIGWLGATWFKNDDAGRAKAFKHLT